MRLIGWLIGAVVLATPVYGIVTSLAGVGAVRWFLGVSEGPQHADPTTAITMLPLLLVGAAVWHVVMAFKAGGRPELVVVLKRSLTSSLLMVLGGVVMTRLLTLVTPADEGALTFGPLLGCGVPVLAILLRRFRRPTHDTPAVGDIWWADVPFDEVADSKDRPCLVIDVNGDRAVVLMITSVDKSRRPGYLPMDSSGWYEGEKSSWLRVDRRIPLRLGDFRRYAGSCPAETWAQVEQLVLSGADRGAARSWAPPPVGMPVSGAVRTVAPTVPAIPMPHVQDDVRTPSPWSMPAVLGETSAVDDARRGELLAMLALESARTRALFTGNTRYDVDTLAELRRCAAQGDLGGLWDVAVTETCLAFAGVVPAARQAAAAGDAGYPEIAAILVNLTGRLVWCSGLPFARPQVVGAAPLGAPFRYAAQVAPGDVDGWATASVGAFRELAGAV